VLSGGGVASLTIFESPANGGGGRGEETFL
jgi:hypothetical protein